MPRSGTTLIEQIIASHQNVSGGGELENFSQAVATCFKAFPSGVAEAGSKEFLELGKTYLNSIVNIRGKSRHMTDKMPKITLEDIKILESEIDKVNKDICKELVDLLIVCDQGRYSPQAVNKKDTVINEMKVLLKKIDREMT
ncbi:MAG: hypothetical protein CMG06_06380 [Candidatus Marinimicrobia bacterium]|nr:hypothetical protein [Candidatus Neomarinimicrobiota bacterium]